jgi:hypothetical protein
MDINFTTRVPSEMSKEKTHTRMIRSGADDYDGNAFLDERGGSLNTCWSLLAPALARTMTGMPMNAASNLRINC